ncbi:hypothetical protein TNCV_1518221 [Trichonephila clavipes]|nr:hypothetical protein TNCV_1518221 [Trichonephila clavipes]
MYYKKECHKIAEIDLETLKDIKSIPYCLYAQPKVRLSKQQDEDHERYAAQRYPTHVQSVTYPANTQAKEEAVPAANQDRFDSLGDMWTCIILLEYSPWQSLQERNILGL